MILKVRTGLRPRTKVLIAFISFAFVFAGAFLVIDFTSQAPNKDWKEPWKNACEETSIVIVDHFYNKKALNTETAEKEISKILKIKEKEFGKSADENAEKIVFIINNFLSWEARIVENPTIEKIKEQIDNNNPVILPVDGRKLSNKYFNPSGYHVFVISGYEDDKRVLIAQEPGTQFGKNYPYSYATIMEAMHDYDANSLSSGRKVAIFTSPEIKLSSSTDGDKDGLTKDDELKFKTSLTSADTDNDGYGDGEEVKNGYSPIIAEKNIKDGSLVRVEGTTKIYLVQNGNKRYVVNIDALKMIMKQSGGIKTVSPGYLDSLKVGKPIVSWPE